MKKFKTTGPEALLLGIEGGGTRTIAILARAGGQLVRRLELGPGNFKLLPGSKLRRHFRSIARVLSAPDAAGISMAGVRSDDDRRRVARAAAAVWPGVPCRVTHDLESAWWAAEALGLPAVDCRVVVLSGTGSCCYGRTRAGQGAKLGGWGHLLGDKGSGYEIGLRALKAVVYYYDRDGRWPDLGAKILSALSLNAPDDLIGWAQAAEKKQIAALAKVVFESWKTKDRIARDILEAAAQSLAKDAVACARRLAKPPMPVQFVLAGSVFLKQPRFVQRVGRLLREKWPGAQVRALPVESAWGAVRLAATELAAISRPQSRRMNRRIAGAKNRRLGGSRAASTSPAAALYVPDLPADSITEQRNPRSMKLHRLSTKKAVELMLSEEEKVPAALRRHATLLAKAVDGVARAVRRGGRLFYVGAGTSGRLGVLDASECPPTFRTPPDLVQGIMAGGQTALWRSVEGAEDDAGAGQEAVRFRRVNRKDVVVGISASGRAPYVWGALQEARRAGAATILLCFNPKLRVARAQRPDLILAPDLGPEILTGSTRLKAGTATKMTLNLLTTLAMVQCGKVVSNLMVDLDPTNSKLRDRAVRILQALTKAREEACREALEKSRWVIRKAWEVLRRRAVERSGRRSKG